MQVTPDNIHGWFDFKPLYDRVAETMRPDAVVIELGVWKAKSLIYLANRMLEVGKPDVQVIGIDSFRNEGWDGYNNIQHEQAGQGEHRSIEQQARDNISIFCKNPPRLIVSEAIAAADLFENGSVDFIFVDDTHSNSHVFRELTVWLPKMRRPTWIAGHDYPGNISGAVDHFFPDREISDWPSVDGKCWIAQLL